MESETVRVTVADALAGSLPAVCCMSGAPAVGFAPVIVPRRLGIAWLLLLGGPLGAVLLVVLWPKLRVRYVVRLPMSSATFDRWYLLRVRRLWCGWLGGLGVILSCGLWWLPGVALAVAGTSLLGLGVAIGAHLRLPWAVPSAIVDARGRTLTLRGVNPRFASACEGVHRGARPTRRL